MADNDSEGVPSAGDSASAKGKFKLIAIAVGILLLAAGGGVYFFMFSHPKEDHVEVAPPKLPSFIDVPEILVNLAGQPGERVQYLKAKVVLEVKDALQVPQITPAMPRITDMCQTYLRELRATDLNGSIGMFRLKEELTRRVNAAVAPNQVNAVLFKEILIQ
ncbi:flagellar basal body-associated protein FliL [Tardiphaga sp.]|jgi:flagellar FliL protein|uniref:flagellar basal body-associated protein FliL n=1 Tax=Tardiphaga sp. TaxID=1926292 RepID=UPI0019A7F651|nr:flagellar basal body-associated protein FliL [Tardiphaga sp.]MBC7580229.1 flagellar basal body-associated protein FliL [Tardiphaga sp.]